MFFSLLRFQLFVDLFVTSTGFYFLNKLNALDIVDTEYPVICAISLNVVLCLIYL